MRVELEKLRRGAAEARTTERPRCPHCHLPHDLTPGSMAVTACASIRARLGDAKRLHADGVHSQCAAVDCNTARARLEARQDPTPDSETPDVCGACHVELCETCRACACDRGADNTCGSEDCPGTRVRHSGPHTDFCVLCLSDEHERLDDRDPEAEERERDIQRDTHIAVRTDSPGAINPAPIPPAGGAPQPKETDRG
jgi:hypothetical protein